MAVMAEDRPLFENDEWSVTAAGLEHKQTGYFLEREELGQRRGDNLWAWPLHMAEKSWCAMAPFTEAFSRAAAIYGINTDPDLARSFALAQDEIAAWPCYATVHENHAGEHGYEVSSRASDLLQDKRAITILVKAGWSNGYEADPVKKVRISRANQRSRFPTRAYDFAGKPGATTSHFKVTAHWRTPHGIRAAGTRIVHLLQNAWSR